MSGYPQLISLPILAGPYSRRRRVRFRGAARQFVLIAATVMAASALAALVL